MSVKEWHRTVILLVLLAIAAGFLFWSAHATDTNFVDTI
jgi:hypothetical protein